MVIPRRLTLTALFVIAGLVIVAGTGSFTASDPSLAPIPGIGAPERNPGIATDGGAPTMGGGDAPTMGVPEGNQTKGDRSIIRRADLALTVDAIEAAIERAEQTIAGLGGETSNSSIGGWIPVPLDAGKDEASATLEPATAYVLFRVPAERLADAVRALRTLGEVTSYSTGSEDVTIVVADLDARLIALRAAEASYLALVERATDVADVMAVYTALTEVRAQIESLEAQARGYADSVAMASLSVSFTRTPQPIAEATEGFDPLAIAERAIGDLAAAGRGLLGSLIYLTIVVGPFLLVGGTVLLVRRLRRR